jgi:Outer membrane protein beta-barrel domain
MNKSLIIIALFALTAAAQDAPRIETFLGYTYVRANSATFVPAFSSNGGSGQFVYNFNRWFGAVADLGAVHNGKIGSRRLDSTFATFLFGPRLTLGQSPRIAPYFQVLWGGVYATTSTETNGVLPPDAALPILPGQGTINNLGQALSARLVANETAFAMTAGGGLDIKISKHMSLRPIGLDYYLTRLQNLRSANDNNQNNLRYTAGINFTFGAQ